MSPNPSRIGILAPSANTEFSDLETAQGTGQGTNLVALGVENRPSFPYLWRPSLDSKH